MNLDSSRGNKIIFTGENGSPFQEKEAKKLLEVGKVYEIDYIVKGNWFNYVSLKGVKGQFPTEMFKDCE